MLMLEESLEGRVNKQDSRETDPIEKERIEQEIKTVEILCYRICRELSAGVECNYCFFLICHPIDDERSRRKGRTPMN